MKARTLEEIGVPFVDGQPVEDPTIDQSAEQGNRSMADSVFLTWASPKAGVFFPTNGSAPAVLSPATVAHRSQWGTGSDTKPAIEKTGTGLYTLTYATSFTDDLDEEEVLDLRPLSIVAMSGDAADNVKAVFLTVSANEATIAVYAGGVLADVGDVSGDPINVSAWFA